MTPSVPSTPPAMCSRSPETRFTQRAFLPELLVRSVFDPNGAGGAVLPPQPVHHLVLISAGRLALERRALGASRWRPTAIEGPGDLHVASADSEGYEVRWTTDASAPISVAHVNLARSVTARVAREHGADLHGREIEPCIGVRDPFIEQLVHALVAALETPRDSDRAFADVAAEMLALHLLRAHSRMPLRLGRARGGLPAARLRRVEELVAARLAESLLLHELAAEAGLSTYHFARAFKASTGETPHAFVLRRRMDEARRLLRASELPIAQIARRVGFSGQAQLTARFRVMTGTTPAKFRRG